MTLSQVLATYLIMAGLLGAYLLLARRRKPMTDRLQIAVALLCVMIENAGTKADKVRAALEYADLLLSAPPPGAEMSKAAPNFRKA